MMELCGVGCCGSGRAVVMAALPWLFAFSGRTTQQASDPRRRESESEGEGEGEGRGRG